MLSYDDALNMNYYKKTSFTGWMGKLRFKILMEKVTVPDPSAPPVTAEDGSESPATKQVSQFRAITWPGPYNYDTTPEDQKTSATFPFTEEGRRQAVDWVYSQL